MDVLIRPERLDDYASVAELQARAFWRDECIGEILLVDAQRHAAGYDPELALVADLEGRIVGNAVYCPQIVYLLGEPLPAVLLSPLAVVPEYQKQGIGAQLMAAAEERALQKGYVLAFLVGHESYYPRFGYHSHMFGHSRLHIKTTDIPASSVTLSERQVMPQDMPDLRRMWLDWFADVDMAIEPSQAMFDWITLSPNIRSAVLTRGETVVGYRRWHISRPQQPNLFLAADEEATAQALAHLAGRLSAAGSPPDEIAIPAQPASSAARRYLPYTYRLEQDAWGAAMVKPLGDPHPSVARFIREREDGTRPPGLLIYPPLFEVA